MPPSDFLVTFGDRDGIIETTVVAVTFIPDNLTVPLEISQLGVRRLSENPPQSDIEISVNASFEGLHGGTLDLLAILGAGKISIGGKASLLSELLGPLAKEAI